jgi:hypothetical protein
MTPPVPYPIDPVPAVIACEGRRVITEGVQGASIQPIVTLDNCAYPVLNSSNCIAMLDRVIYDGVDLLSPLNYTILWPQENNGKAAVRFDAVSFRDVSFNPTVAHVGASFLCAIPSYPFSVGRCNASAVSVDLLGVGGLPTTGQPVTNNVLVDLGGASTTETETTSTTSTSSATGSTSTGESAPTPPPLPCPALAGATLDSYFFSVESYANGTVTWAYAFNWPQPVVIENCAIVFTAGQPSEIPPQCLPARPVYATVLSMINPALFGPRHVIYPFFSRQTLHVAEAGYRNGGVITTLPGGPSALQQASASIFKSATAAQSATLAGAQSFIFDMQAIQFAFAFNATSAGLMALGYPDLPALQAVGPPKLALAHKRGDQVGCFRAACALHSLILAPQEVWFPLATVPDFSIPVIVDESLENLQFRYTERPFPFLLALITFLSFFGF